MYTNKPDNRVEPGRLSEHKGRQRTHKGLVAGYEPRFPERARPQMSPECRVAAERPGHTRLLRSSALLVHLQSP